MINIFQKESYLPAVLPHRHIWIRWQNCNLIPLVQFELSKQARAQHGNIYERDSRNLIPYMTRIHTHTSMKCCLSVSWTWSLQMVLLKLLKFYYFTLRGVQDLSSGTAVITVFTDWIFLIRKSRSIPKS